MFYLSSREDFAQILEKITQTQKLQIVILFLLLLDFLLYDTYTRRNSNKICGKNYTNPKITHFYFIFTFA